MVATLDEPKRMVIAMQMAEMKARQNLLIRNDQLLIDAMRDDSIRQHL